MEWTLIIGKMARIQAVVAKLFFIGRWMLVMKYPLASLSEPVVMSIVPAAPILLPDHRLMMSGRVLSTCAPLGAWRKRPQLS